jgi:TonB family protein
MLVWNESAWFTMLLGAALKGTLVLGAAWSLAFALRRQSAASRHLVWTAAAAALLALPALSVALPALRVRTAALAPLVPTLTFRANAVATAGAPVSPQPEQAGAAQPVKRAPWRPDFRLWLTLAWAAGSALALAHMLAAYFAMWRIRRAARPFRDPQLFDELAHALGIRHRVELLEAPRGTMPLNFGVLRPVVFLPTDAHQWSEDRRRVVLLHELAHVKRGDMAVHLLVRTALCLFWWNPLAWTAWRESLKERERATDDLVLTAGERATEYASHLLELARSMQSAQPVAWAAIAMARPSQLEGRLLAILDARTNRQSPGRRSVLVAALSAVALVAPFAALQAQEKVDPVTPPAVDAAIRAANDQKNSDILDSAATAYEATRKYDEAQKLLENSLAIRAQNSGDHSSAYAIGLMKLGDLAVKRGQGSDAMDFYTRAAALGDTPETAPALIYLAGRALGSKDTVKAESLVDRSLAVAPSGALAGHALTVKGNIALANGLDGVAELQYLQALAQDPPDSPEAALTMETYAGMLTHQSRTGEAQAMKGSAKTIRDARVAALTRTWKGAGSVGGGPSTAEPGSARPADSSSGISGSGISRVGNGVSAPVLLSKQEPQYTADATATKIQGTVVLYVVIGTDGHPYNLRLTRSLGFGLDEKAAEAVNQWQFLPGKRDGSPVAVEATIEVNFRLL